MTAVTQRTRAASTAAASPWRPAGWRWLATPLLAWAVSRVVILAAIGVGNAVRGDGQSIVDALHLWDGNWYLDAAEGYDLPVVARTDVGKSDIAFFPLFPLLIRGLMAVTGWPTLPAAIIVTALTGAAAIVAIWLWMRRLAGVEAADRAAWLTAMFPASVVLTMIYAEGVMLAAAAACLLALHERRWVWAGVFAALASAARPNGIALAAACGVAALLAIRQRREWRALAAPLLAPLGMTLYLGWLWLRTGAADSWLRVQREGWGETLDFGRSSWVLLTRWAPQLVTDVPGDWPLTVVLRLGGLLVVVAGAIALWRWRPPAAVAVYTAAILLLPLISRTLGARPRFVLAAFPLVCALAWIAQGNAYRVLLGGSTVALTLVTAMYTTPGLVVP